MTNKFLQKCDGDWPPANPYSDPNSPESVAIREGTLDCLKKPEDRGTLNLKKECRDGGKGRKEGEA